MLVFFYRRIVLVASIFFIGCFQSESKIIPTKFEITKGVNIGNWLSRSKLRGEQRRKIFTPNDIEKLATYGFDHIRLPVDEEQIFSGNGQMDKEAISLVHRTIQACKKNGLKVIFDLHMTRSHYYFSKNNALWESKEEQQKLVWIWKQFMGELEKYPVDLVAYELLNEPVAPEDEQWNSVARQLIQAVRNTNKKRIIILGANMWNSVNHIKNLYVPQNDPNIILSIHFYEPLLLTHYQASWNIFAKLKLSGDLNYPGQLIPDDLYNKLSSKEKKLVSPYNHNYNKEYIRKRFLLAVNFARSKHLRLHLGEFGCLSNSGEKARLSWLSDVVSICREYNIAYSLWEYNNVFGFAERYTGKIINPRMLKILTGK